MIDINHSGKIVVSAIQEHLGIRRKILNIAGESDLFCI